MLSYATLYCIQHITAVVCLTCFFSFEAVVRCSEFGGNTGFSSVMDRLPGRFVILWHHHPPQGGWTYWTSHLQATNGVKWISESTTLWRVCWMVSPKPSWSPGNWNLIIPQQPFFPCGSQNSPALWRSLMRWSREEILLADNKEPNPTKHGLDPLFEPTLWW